jgi:DNA polymerase I
VKQFFDKEWAKLKRLPQKDRIVRSPMGRIRRFDSFPSRALERSFKMTWPQQIEAHLIKIVMVRLDRIFRRRNMKAQIIMMIHDALWVECPQNEAEQVKQLVRRMMIKAEKLTVPITVDFQD